MDRKTIIPNLNEPALDVLRRLQTAEIIALLKATGHRPLPSWGWEEAAAYLLLVLRGQAR